MSTVEPLCPEPTTKTKRRGDRLPVEEGLSIGQLERFIETGAVPAPGSGFCELRTQTFSSQQSCCLLGAGFVPSQKRRYAEGESDKVRQIGSTLVAVTGQIAAVALTLSGRWGIACLDGCRKRCRCQLSLKIWIRRGLSSGCAAGQKTRLQSAGN